MTATLVSNARTSFWPIAARISAILVLTFLALYYRRPDQLYHPYIWVEDGTISLIQYIDHGLAYLFDPVAGYLIVPSKIIQLISLTLSVSHYPEIAYWLTVLFHAGILVAIALSPTALRAPFLCAVFTLLIPSDSEVFGTSHYIFWWTSLLAILPVLWRKEADHRVAPQIVLTIIAGLSSPLIIALLPLFALRWLVIRSRNALIVAAVAVSCALTQLYFLLTTQTHGTSLPTSIDVAELVRKFFGMFVYWSPSTTPGVQLAIGASLIIVICVAAGLSRSKLGWPHTCIALGLMASIAISVARVPVEVMHPLLAGPRYFFYPFIFLGWLLIELAAASNFGWIRAALLLPLIGATHQFVAYGPRGHHSIDWQQQMNACLAAPGAFTLKVHFAGNARETWTAIVPPGGCRKLYGRTLMNGVD